MSEIWGKEREGWQKMGINESKLNKKSYFVM